MVWPRVPQSAWLPQLTRISQPECVVPRRELRFEMLPADASAVPPGSGPAVCLAVYQLEPGEDAAPP